MTDSQNGIDILKQAAYATDEAVMQIHKEMDKKIECISNNASINTK